MTYYIGSIEASYGDIQHHGIKGQKWGTRRWQNKDGSLTPEGYIHYGYGQPSDKKQPVKQTKKETTDSDGNHVGGNDTKKALAVNLLLDAITLNPIGLVQDSVTLVKGARASAKEKKYLENRAKNGVLDKKTGLYKKQTEMSEIEDCKAVNPGFANFDDDTKNNCSLCSATYEMRRRGYDVIAKKDTMGKTHKEQEVLYKNGKFTNIGFDDSVFDNMTPKEYISHMKELRKSSKENRSKFVETLSQQKNARGCIGVLWASGGAHSMVYEVKDGQLQIFDCQSGKVYSNPNSILKYGIGFSYMRTDNLKVNMQEMKKRVM